MCVFSLDCRREEFIQRSSRLYNGTVSVYARVGDDDERRGGVCIRRVVGNVCSRVQCARRIIYIICVIVRKFCCFSISRAFRGEITFEKF